MPRKKSPPNEELPPDLQPLDVSEDAYPADVERALAELGESVSSVVLYRRLKMGKQAYVTSMPADEFTLEAVKGQFGGGTYVARFKDADGRWVVARQFTIDERFIAPPQIVGAAVAHDSTAEALRELAREMRDSRPTAPAVDPMDVAAKLGAVAATQFSAITTMMAPLLAQRSGGETDTRSVLDAVRLGVELSGEGGGENSMAPLLREFGLPLLRLLEKHTGQAPTPMPANPGAPGTAVAPGAAPAWVALLRPYVPKLLTLAARGEDTNLWAAVVDSQAPRLARWLEATIASKPAFVDDVLSHFPALTPHREWVAAFLGEFAQEDETDEDAKPGESAQAAEP